MLQIYNRDYISLDSLIDIDNFLLLQDNFYEFFAEHSNRCLHFWNSAGISLDNNWPYLQDNPSSYSVYHKILNGNDLKEKERIRSFSSRDRMIRYLQLKYGTFSPYQLLHFSNSSNNDIKIPKEIKNWINSLPFQKINLISFFFTDHYVPLKYHRDHNYFPFEEGDNPIIPNTQTDFIWLRWDQNKEFNLYELSDSGEILDVIPIEGYSAIFNHYNWHGSTVSNNSASLSIKIEGEFTDSFRRTAYRL